MKEKASFVVVNTDGSEFGDYSGAEPKAAATKAVNRMYNAGDSGTISIRKRNTKTIRDYQFSVTLQPKPDAAPAWMPAQVKKSKLMYVGRRFKE